MNRIPGVGQIAVLVLSITWVAPASAATLRCPPDSVKVGDACIDLSFQRVQQQVIVAPMQDLRSGVQVYVHL